jgi:sulfur-oxidizing protein SoxB
MTYRCEPGAKAGQRITNMRLAGKPIDAGRKYKVAGWAPVAEEARNAPGVKPIWTVVETWLKSQPAQRVKPRAINTPALVGIADDPGIAGLAT